MSNYLVVGNAPTTTLTTIAFVSVSFLILMLLIKKFAWGPITKMLEDRENKIASDLDGAEKARTEAKGFIKQSEDGLTQSKAEAAAIIRRAKENAEHNADSILAEAKKEAQTYRDKARTDIVVEREQIIESAKREVADLSVQIAEKILKKELNKETHESLINSYIEGLGNYNED